MQPSKISSRLEILQALRGIAALSVLLCHSDLKGNGIEGAIALGPAWFGWGWMGVDVFFCLSGFVIMWVHGGDVGFPARAGAFAWKRFVRIYPPYLILLPFIAGASYLAARHGYQTLNHIPPAILRPGALIQSIALLPPYSELIVGVAWTLVHEVLFYILFCGAIVLGRRAAQIAVCLWLAAIFFYPHPDGGTASLSCDILFSPYNLEFLGGVGAAWLVRQQSSSVLPWVGVVLALSFLATGFGLDWWHFFRGNQSPSFLPEKIALAVCFATLLFSLVRLELSGWIRVPVVLVFLGEASYSIYLVHDNVIRWTGAALLHLMPSLPEHPGRIQLVLAGCALLALGCGLAYYGLVERPILRRCRQWLKGSGSPANASPQNRAVDRSS